MPTLIPPPAAFGVREYKFRLSRTTPIVRGTYSLEETQIDFGGEMWVAEYSIKNLPLEGAGAVRAWVDRCRDVGNIAQLGSPMGAGGRFGTETAATLTATTGSVAGSRNVTASGTAGATLLAGTFMSINSHLHELRQDVTFNGAGNTATLELRPRLRAAIGVSQIIQIDPATVKSAWLIEEPDFDTRSSRDVVLGGILKLSEALKL